MGLADSISAYSSAAIQCGLSAASIGKPGTSATTASKCIDSLRAAYGVLSGLNDLHAIGTGSAPVTPTTAADLASIGVAVPQSASDAEIERLTRESASIITEMKRQTMEELRSRASSYSAAFQAQRDEERMWQYVAAASAVVLVAGIGTSYYFYSISAHDRSEKGSV